MSLQILDAVRFLIQHTPGRTQKQLSEEVFGPGAEADRVHWECDHLIRQGEVERRGTGGSSDPFTYYPTKVDA